ncbi:hypothetical protein [Macrococcus animalis]|uniref:hypothetical protein n=1 Tax=Macrococcus animalis TaxID=3395467 RepID=UPI0039BE433C
MNEKIKGFSKSAGNVGKKVAKTTGKGAVKTAKFTGKVALGATILIRKEFLEEAKRYQNNK